MGNEHLWLINLLGLIGLGVGQFYGNLRSGKDKVGSEVLALYKEQIAALEKDVQRTRDRSHELGNQMQDVKLQLGILKGQLEEKDKKLAEYAAIIENRDPALQTVLKEIRDFMHILYEQSDMNQKRNQAQDVASTTEKGKILRKGDIKTK